ncbi:hypothetical protein [Streptomyces sp. NRRL WC-3742]|uniref:hypothetical protein n=1 Tax=Streptomyces sp. NRRL WC-3742 TaxID=1463934 RepID=UPI000B015975|nr:hypothetical protein [Streptomyces sp. NRRL WC-3742]
MANDQSATQVPSTPQNGTKTEAPATAVEAGKAVEGAVAAASNPTEYTAPTADRKAALENDLFGDEADHVVEPAKPAADEPGKKYGPQDVIAGHP